ncbi:hypothetical protein RI129_005143 [Pyrocoelia pectoralis]|uniref:Pre-mRNA-splicing factor CWC25 n=1 Tax=Pyrocoelia pectoralis TaxID=417401 RepID=A0AAN7VM65_9COLE
MFTQNQSEVKLEWMYKGPHSTVDREEYLLGKSVDKSLEQLNVQEKQQQLGVQPPKNHVEHECIPPSIRDYKEQLGEQVDINAKLQEDPLIAIKKREEENRRQFLNNPIQIKKLQEALQFQKSKRKGKHKSSDSDSEHELNKKLAKKLKSLGNSSIVKNKNKTSKKDVLDTILMHKYNQLKSQLTNTDIRDVLEGKKSETSSSSSNDNDSEENEKLKRSKQKLKLKNKYKSHALSNKSRRRSSSPEVKKYKNKINESVKHRARQNKSHDSGDDNYKRRKMGQISTHKSANRRRSRSYSSSDSEPQSKRRPEKYNSDSQSDSESNSKKKKNFGLVRADGTKIPLVKSKSAYSSKEIKSQQVNKDSNIKKRGVLTEEEKDKKRREMMENAFWRDKERANNIKLYRESNSKEDLAGKEYKPEFLKKELLKSANNSSVESRIKANINNIQRSSGDMSKHFSKRY